jgi:hypothetical protein
MSDVSEFEIFTNDLKTAVVDHLLLMVKTKNNFPTINICGSHTAYLVYKLVFKGACQWQYALCILVMLLSILGLLSLHRTVLKTL